MKDNSGEKIGTLDLYYQEMNENGELLYYQANGGLPITTTPSIYPYYVLEHGIDTTDIGHPDVGMVGAAWNMSPLTKEMLDEYMFMIELGENVWDSLIQDYNWSPLAYSDTVEGQWLKNKYTSENGTIAPPNFNPWTPMNYHTVPEPSELMLCIIGFGLLLLKRKTNG